VKRPTFVRVVRSGHALVIHCSPRPAPTLRMTTFTAADVASAWIAEYLAIRAEAPR